MNNYSFLIQINFKKIFYSKNEQKVLLNKNKALLEYLSLKQLKQITRFFSKKSRKIFFWHGLGNIESVIN